MKRFLSYLSWERFGSLGILLVLCVVITIFQPRFASISNLTNVLRQGAVLALATFGQTIVVIAGGIDLSMGSLAALVSMITALAAKQWGVAPGFASGLALAAFLGGINGVLVSKLKVPPFIATVGMLTYGAGLAQYIGGGLPIEFVPDGFQFVGGGYAGPIPMPVIVALVVAIVVHFFLTRTTAGRYIYFLGGNPEAARYSGVNVDRYRLLAYVLSGLLAGAAAIVLSSRVNSGQPSIDPTLPFEAIAAVAVGGISTGGGEGNLGKAVIGVLIITCVSNGLNLANVSSYIQQMTIGAVMVLAVAIDNIQKFGLLPTLSAIRRGQVMALLARSL
jgi:ribose/xylose/arabinose/galactoside ABC-type transport system permease subunit